MGLFNFLTGMATGMWDFSVIKFELIEYEERDVYFQGFMLAFISLKITMYQLSPTPQLSPTN